MAKSKNQSCGIPGIKPSGSYKVESIITIDGRGQMVLPKEIRDQAGILAGDKLAVVTWSKGDKVCCISLIKAEELAEMVKGLLGTLATLTQD
ncbi:MAG: AbrB/MazE/SpoVT family DNA-binding domain-containing protein [Deltaproteobacteria bacterium]|nr:AbrB/MazE/SpoVT family DNA-binding domain-containing protein [Deltaproteobacteria bacterium]